jgi:hypothetical protein
MVDRWVRSASGGIHIQTTERGVPTEVKINSRELSRSPQEMAREILLLCKLSAIHDQVTKRRELTSRGVGSEVIRSLRLATEQDLAQAEAEWRGVDDDLPASWKRPV